MLDSFSLLDLALMFIAFIGWSLAIAGFSDARHWKMRWESSELARQLAISKYYEPESMVAKRWDIDRWRNNPRR
jgi:hypothetical protein